MDTTVIAQVAALRRMTAAELRHEWFRVFGEQPRSGNRDWRWRRLSYRIQEDAHGGLSDAARARLESLAPTIPVRGDTPNVAPPAPPERSSRDPRLPTPGSVISKRYKGQELRVVARDDGFEFDGAMYPSLTALAKHITGSKSINGKLFFGITQRKRS